MRLLAHVHMAPPFHMAGAETMLVSIMERLQVAHGWDCRIITTRPPRRSVMHRGIRVEMVRDMRSRENAYRWSDVVLTHLDVTRHAMEESRRLDRPLVHLVHNDRQLAFHDVTPDDAALVIFNSQWIADAHPGWSGPSMVLNPPVWPSRFPESTGNPDGAVTLVNVMPAKGAPVFYDLAASFPDRQFLGVKGAYGVQVAPPRLPNLKVIGCTTRIVEHVYAKTAVLVMPSWYESWGQVAVEGALCSIPTIAAPTPGLVETGVPHSFAHVDNDNDEWQARLSELADPDTITAAGATARSHALELAVRAEAQVAELDAHLRAI